MLLSSLEKELLRGLCVTGSPAKIRGIGHGKTQARPLAGSVFFFFSGGALGFKGF